MNAVPFKHAVHEAANETCRSCHHETLKKCGDCHTETGLPDGGKVQLAQAMHWHLSMVGTVFVALATTMPELVVTISAIRLKAVDLAVGDLLGSLLVNVAMLGIMDLLYTRGLLLQDVGPENATTGVLVIIMVSIAIVEMIYRPQLKLLRWMSLGAFLLAFMYGVHIVVKMLTG